MLSNILIVLVETTHSGNIGATARAMKNMGLSRLALVNPLCKLDSDCYSRASGANDVLDNVEFFSSLKDALAKSHFAVATSARERKITLPFFDPRQIATKVLSSSVSDVNEIAFVFGRESSGLKNEELDLCRFLVHIPSVNDFSSLNVASAIQIIAYELRMASLQLSGRNSDVVDIRERDLHALKVSDMELFYEHLEKVLVLIDFLDPGEPKKLMTRLRRLYGRIDNLSKIELNILRGILSSVEKKVE